MTTSFPTRLVRAGEMSCAGRMRRTVGYGAMLLLLLLVWVCCAAPVAAAGDEDPVDFSRDIRPLLSDRCFQCHGPSEEDRQGGFRLDVKESAFGESDSGEHPIVPGDLEHSEMYQRITAEDSFMRMPPPDSNKTLSPDEIATIAKWIKQGAPWHAHWAYMPPQKAPLPEVQQKEWPQNPIDYFVLARLEKNHLHPAPPADRMTLIRRVTFDLTGLPPDSGRSAAVSIGHDSRRVRAGCRPIARIATLWRTHGTILA